MSNFLFSSDTYFSRQKMKDLAYFKNPLILFSVLNLRNINNNRAIRKSNDVQLLKFFLVFFFCL